MNFSRMQRQSQRCPRAPIRVTGTAMGLLLNLQVSRSVMLANCPLTSANPTVNPAFTVTLASSPKNLQNGKMSSLRAREEIRAAQERHFWKPAVNEV
jgi:hypothetical protein